MSVDLESRNRIANLISAANAKTGNADADLTAAVGSLISGFGQGGSGGGASKTLSVKAFNTSTLTTNIRGYWAGVEAVEIDMGGVAGTPPVISYFGCDKVGAVCNYLGTQNATSVQADMFRQAAIFSEINFVDGLYPTSLTRFLYQQFAYYGADGMENTNYYMGEIKVTGIHLDNLTSFNNFGGDAKGNTLNILWEGTLYNSVTVESANSMTAESVSRLIGCLADYSDSDDTHTLTLGSTLLAKAAEADIALAAQKGWTLA